MTMEMGKMLMEIFLISAKQIPRFINQMPPGFKETLSLAGRKVLGKLVGGNAGEQPGELVYTIKYEG